jgi:hypothetical protein
VSQAPQKQLDCDVLVSGGGSAGVAAAVAAGRAGARVILIERHGLLGGMASVALVHSICGLYLLRRDPQPILAHDGFPSEFAQRLLATGGAHGPQRMGRVDVLLQQPTAFAHLCDQLTAATPNVRVLLHSEMTAVQVNRNAARHVSGVDVQCRGSRMTVAAKAVVDTTGDAELAAMLDLPVERAEADRLQRPAFIFALQGVDVSALADDGRLKLSAQLVAAVRDGALPRASLGAAVRPSGRGGEVFVTIDLDGGPGAYDPTDAACLSALESQGRSLATGIAAHLRSHVAGFDSSFISTWPGRVGVRESRRWIGEYRIEEADVLSGATFDDAVGLSTWPMELRETARGPRLRFPHNDRPCEVPLRALRSRDMDNAFLAGRCISASHEAQASLRVIGTCLMTGEAAGLAAALLARRDASQARQPVAAADVVALRRTLAERHNPHFAPSAEVPR